MSALVGVVAFAAGYVLSGILAGRECQRLAATIATLRGQRDRAYAELGASPLEDGPTLPNLPDDEQRNYPGDPR